MENVKKLFVPLIWIVLGIVIHMVYVNNRPVKEIELREISETESIKWFNAYMEMPFSDIDTVQEIRNQTRVKRVEFTQHTLKKLNEINSKLGSPETIRLYFGNEDNATHFMVMAFENAQETKAQSSIIAQGSGEGSQDEEKNQTDQIYVIEGKTPPTCPYVCDREGPYTR